GDGDAADLHGLEHGVRVERAGASHVDPDLVELGDLDLGRELAGDGPTRLAVPHGAQLGVQGERVDLHHDAVGPVVQGGEQLLERGDFRVGVRQVGDERVVLFDREPPRGELLEQLVLRRDRQRYTSPRTSMGLGQALPVSRRGTSTTVRRLAVTSSPTRPLPRVAPTTNRPCSYVRLTAAPSIFTSSV